MSSRPLFIYQKDELVSCAVAMLVSACVYNTYTRSLSEEGDYSNSLNLAFIHLLTHTDDLLTSDAYISLYHFSVMATKHLTGFTKDCRTTERVPLTGK